MDIHPNMILYSDEMIANLVLANNGKIITPNTYNYPVYFADADTSRWDIPCTRYRCVVPTSDGGIRTDMLEDVPIPLDAQPSRKLRWADDYY